MSWEERWLGGGFRGPVLRPGLWDARVALESLGDDVVKDELVVLCEVARVLAVLLEDLEGARDCWEMKERSRVGCTKL